MRELELEQGAPKPLLLGRHLLEIGLEPGPRIGEITRAVYEMQLDGRLQSLEEAKAAAKRLISADYAKQGERKCETPNAAG